MKFRKLRIAWSVGCAIVCVLLIVLWVRSYWRADYFNLRVGSTNVGAVTVRGSIIWHWKNDQSKRQASYSSAPVDRVVIDDGDRKDLIYPLYRFGYHSTSTLLTVATPLWSVILLSGALTAAAWLRWRFSLRTLLIATTLVAMVLGLAVWAASR